MNSKLYLTILLFTLHLGQLRSQCSFTVSNPSPCAEETVLFFVDNPNGGSTYDWDFDGDGTIDTTGTDVEFVFPLSFTDVIYNVGLFENDIFCTSQSVTVLASPDPSIGVPPGIVTLVGNELKACNGSSAITIEIFNASLTYADNVGYEINWGDGTPSETYDNSTFSNVSTISHTYNSLGYYTIFVTATHQNGCVYTTTYTFYNGGNPSVGLVLPGNTVGLCAPATLTFPITNTLGNPPGTEYTIFVNGEEVASYDQDNVPAAFTYTFLEGSCGDTTSTGNYVNAFDLKIVASNPCNSSTATIEPIEVSEPPEPFFLVTPPASPCPGSTFGFENGTTNGTEVISGNPSTCVGVLNPTWSILQGVPGQDWEVVSGSLFGSSQIEVNFLTPGVYTIQMTIVSFACGTFTFSQDITVTEPPVIDAGTSSIDPMGNNGCVPVEVSFSNSSSGANLGFNWVIDPPTGWQFINGTDANSTAPSINFTEGGTYTVSLIASNDCADISWDTTLMFPGPPAIALDPIPDFCNTATLDFSNSNLTYVSNGDSITSYLWQFQGADLTSSSAPFPTGINYDTPGNYIVTLTAENGCGPTTVADTFEVQGAIQLTMPPDDEVCVSEAPFAITANPSGGTWSGAGVFPNGLFDPAQAPPGPNQLLYSYGVGACEVQGNMTVVVNPLPIVNAGPNQSACISQTAIQLNGTPAGGAWQAVNGGAINGDQFLPPASGEGTFQLLYDYSDPTTGCANVDSSLVQVNPLPVLTVPDTTYCNTPGTVFLPAATPAGGTWAGPGVLNPNTGAWDPESAGGVGSYPVDYTLTDANGCTNSTNTSVTVVPLPNINAGPDVAICLDDGVFQFTGNVPGGGLWIGSGIVDSQQGLFDPDVTGPGIHPVIYRYGAGSCTVKDTLLVEVIDVTNTTAGPNQSACQSDQPFLMSGSTPAGGVWSGTGIVDPQTGLFDPAVALDGTHVINYTYTDPMSGCSRTDQKLVVIHPTPVAAFDLPVQGCTGQTLNIANNSQGGAVYQWNFGDGSTSQQPTPAHSYADTGTYLVSLSVESAFGCTQTTENEVFIAAAPDPDFEPDLDDGCPDLFINFTDLSAGFQTEYFWDFGNGQTSTEAQPGGPFLYPPGLVDTTYLVSLQLTNYCGTRFHTDTITVHPLPVADFGITLDTGCAPVLIGFNNVSIGSPDYFLWDFGNGQTSTDSLPAIQEYTIDTSLTIYDIVLIAGNECGTDTTTQQLVVEPEEVTAFFNTSSTEGCAPFTVSFENFSTLGTFVSWDFGDGNVVSIDDPIHTFQQPGTYDVTLTADNGCGSDTETISITALPPPQVSFEAPEILCTNQEVQLTNTSPNLGGSQWVFSTGDTSTLTNPSYLFDQPGTYTVALTGYAAQSGCSQTVSQQITIQEPPVANFDLDDPDGCAPLNVPFANTSQGGSYYFWNFGDGNTSVEQHPDHVFQNAGTYPISLVVTNQAGCRDTATFANVLAYPTPVASFDLEKEQECGLPLAVSLFNGSSGADGYLWQLGDGAQTDLTNPEHLFDEAGTYVIQLLATNQYGCLDSTKQEVTAYPQPVAGGEFQGDDGCQPLAVNFANTATDANHYYWDFGDGNTSVEANPSHLFEEAGLFAVSLVVSYDDVCFDTLQLSQPVEVYPTPVATFEWVENPAGEPVGTLQFLNLTDFAISYFWDFGDGNTSTEENPIHRYTEAGLRQIILEVIGENGCADDTLLAYNPPLFGRLFVPNAFTPEQGPGDVRLFFPKGVGLEEYHLQVFSSYGQLLWETTELIDGQPAEGWDGTYKGELLPQDTYVWKIFAIFQDGREWPGTVEQDGQFRKMGTVVLIR